MLKDMSALKIFRRHSGKNSTEGNENIPANSTDSSSSSHVGSESGRPPLNTIQDPAQNPKSTMEQELAHRVKIDRTPIKNKRARSELPDMPLPFRTPEKQGFASFQVKGKFGWGQRNESVSSVSNGGKSPSCSSTQSTPNKSVTKPVNPAFVAPTSCSRPPLGMGTRGGISNMISKGFLVPSAPPMVVNTVEVPHFELREDPSFWMDHNVQVLIRIRPLNNMERNLQGYSRCLRQESAQTVAWIGQPETRFTYDHVACEAITQEMLFRVAGLPMVENCLSGYNSCMFAYGQTGSGKTHTMLGEIDELEVRPSSDRGMTPRIFEFLFARIRAEEESRRDEKLKYSCKCSFLEIYNEQITDLLDTSSTNNLLIREDIKKGVYVENLTEFEVETVHDILKLLTKGAANRKVAATNMNRESSRSHSVFTCVIESQWEKDSTTNLRFARLNLVDLAGSERQKTSGAEGERLKEAANINKSLSTLGHVIMVLVDIAHGKQRHVPYRDSKLTFLLQDSLGGNSKTMIIANVSPSICSSSETLSTLKFAQRAKLIQNNAVVNEDASGDVLALQHQIQLLKEELSFFKRQNVSRSLSFRSTIYGDTIVEERDTAPIDAGMSHGNSDDLNGCTSLGSLRVSTKKLKSLETTLAGALRREKVSDTAAKHLEAEIEQLNRLVRQREEDTRCTKMMLRFREDKIRRMESVINGLMPKDSYLLEENTALTEEIQLLRTRVDKNPEITRFALENIRLLDQLRRFQDFYEEGEREILLAEVSELRDQLLQFVEGNSAQDKYPNLCMEPQEASQFGVATENESLHKELKSTLKELEDCRSNLNSCLEVNAKLTREIGDLQAQLDDFISVRDDPDMRVRYQRGIIEGQQLDRVSENGGEWKNELTMKHSEEIINLQLELDVLKTILEEERLSRAEVEDRVLHLNNDIEMANSRFMHIRKQLEDSENELRNSRSLVEALESQQLLSISELEELRESNKQYVGLLRKQEQEIKMGSSHCQQVDQTSNVAEDEESPFQRKLKKTQNALDKARRLNMKYQNTQASQTSHEQEMEMVRQQVEAETAEAIVCLQEELQQQVDLSILKELEAKKKLMVLETESKVLQGRLDLVVQENEKLSKLAEEKDEEIEMLTKEWERLSCEIAEALSDGYCALEDASDQLEFISDSLPQRSLIGEQVGRLVKVINEKENLIEELQKRLEDAQMIGRDLEWKLRSLRGATLAITEAQQQENCEKDREILQLRSHMSEKVSVITELENKIELGKNQIKKAEICAAVAFVSLMNRLSEASQDVAVSDSQNPSEETGISVKSDFLETKEKLNGLKMGVLALSSSMDEFLEQIGKPGKQDASCGDYEPEGLKKILRTQEKSKISDDTCDENMTVLLLTNEIESALNSLRAVQTQVSRINGENENIKKSEDQSQKTIESLVTQVLRLQTEMDNKEKQFELRMVELSQKLQRIGDIVEESSTCWYQSNEVFALELSDAKVVAAQKTREASGLLSKFEEAQETMKEADILVNALMKANETAKFELESCKKAEVKLIDERLTLIDEIQSLRSVSAQKERQYEQLQAQFTSNLIETENLVLELEEVFMKVQATVTEEYKLMTSDINCLKSRILDSANVTKSWLEDIWSEIIVKDCAVSVLHLCHMGILLETVTGQNAEIGFLHHGLCESNSVIANLRENNLRAKRELETCSVLKGKLLTDIKNGFDRIMKKEDETGELSAKLSDFEKKISDLQMHEAVMLSRSNSMGSELAVLMKEMDRSNKNTLVQEKLLKENNQLRQKVEEACNLQEQIRASHEMFMNSVSEELDFSSEFTQIFNCGNSDPKEEIESFRKVINRQNEFIFAELSAKDFELVILASEMNQRNLASFKIYSDLQKLKEEKQQLCIKLEDSNCENSRMEGELETLNTLLEELKHEMVFSGIEQEVAMDILMEEEVELKQCCENVEEMKKERMAVKQAVQSLKELADEKIKIRDSKIEAMNHLLQGLKQEIVFSEVEKEVTMEILMEEEVELKQCCENFAKMNKERVVIKHEVHCLKELADVQIKIRDSKIEAMNHLLQELKQEMIFSEVEKEVAMEILLEKEVGLKHCCEKIADMNKERISIKKEVQSLKELADEQIKIRDSKIETMNNDFENRCQILYDEVGLSQDLISKLQTSLGEKNSELDEIRGSYSSILIALESKNQEMDILKEENRRLLEDLQTELEKTTEKLNEVQCSNSTLAHDIESKGFEIVILIEKLNSVKVENERLETEIHDLKAERSRVFEDLEGKKLDFESSSSQLHILNTQNKKLKDEICSLQASIAGLKADLEMKNTELEGVQGSNSILVSDVKSRNQQIACLSQQINELQVRNEKLETEIGEINEDRERFLTEVQNLKAGNSRILKELEEKKLEFESSSSQLCVIDLKNHMLNDEICLSQANLNRLRITLDSVERKISHCSNSIEGVDILGNRIQNLVEAKDKSDIQFADKMFEEICEFEERAYNFVAKSERLQMSLQAELARKDDILKGLQFDLSLLQESASNAKDQKDEIEEIVSTLESLEDDLALKSNELDEALAHVQMVEDQLNEKVTVIAALESELEKERQLQKLVCDENFKLKADLEGLLVKKNSIEEDVQEKNKVIERLDEEILEMGSSLDQMAFSLQSAENSLCRITKERDSFDAEVVVLKEQVEMAQSLADENEAIATEARQIAEARKTYAEEKEEEVKLLEKSVEELEYTINALENRVEIVKGEAERQRLQREELEIELQAVKHQLSAVHSAGSIMKMEVQNVMHSEDDDLPWNLKEKVSELQEARKIIQMLEKDAKEKDAEIVQCKAHISELTLHAEAQASECKQKFKALEAMAQQVKPEPASFYVTNATSTKMDKHAVKPRGSASPAAKPRGSSSPFRGSGSPFKCIGLGLTHQINSEKDEELSEGRLRIEELEAVVASKQKEIFMLNTRLAAAESMTHDVIRDLLGVKLDMTNYASLLDHQQVQKITEKNGYQNKESREQEQEVVQLKKQLDEFIEERAGWLDEINRRKAEMVAAKIASEKLQQRDQLLTAENEMLKMDNSNHKKKVMELEQEVKKLSGQQNLQQRIHHHAKIKEENNHLKVQNDELSAKLWRQDTMMSRLRDELARYRASSGKHPYVDLDAEDKLKSKLQETEEERIQLAQKLLSLCTSILKAAGITRPLRDITPSIAEDALSQLKDRVATSERELQDLKFKTRLSGDRFRLSELRQQASPMRWKANENCPTPRRMSQAHL